MSDNKTYFEQQSVVASQKYMNADGSTEKEPSTFNKFMKDFSTPLLIGIAVIGLYMIFREKE